MKTWGVIKGILVRVDITTPGMNSYPYDDPQKEITSFDFDLMDTEWTLQPVFALLVGADGRPRNPQLKITIEVAE